VLQLDAFERRALYSLAFSEIYEVDAALQPVTDGSLLSPVESLSEIEPALRNLATAREEFFTRSTISPLVRPRIANSWRRSLAIGADPLRKTALAAVESDDDLATVRMASEPLLVATAHVRSRLSSVLRDTGYAVIISNAGGCVIETSGGREVLRRLSQIDLVPGADLSEAACGTNAIGTSLADGRPLQVMGAENFCEGGADLTCTAAPVRDPSTHEIAGALNVTAYYRYIRP